MKVNFNAINHGGTPTKNSGLLPLVPEETTPLTKGNSVELLLGTNPAQMNQSPKFKIMQLVLRGGEDVRAVLTWQRDTGRIFHGMHLTTGVDQNKMVGNILADTARTLYDTALRGYATTRRAAVAGAAIVGNRPGILAQHLDQHTEIGDVNLAIQDMITELLPRRVLARVKRFLRRECRKPSDMKVKIYLQHVLRINFSELNRLPPFGVNQELSQDELLDIMLFGTPKSWQKEMERQGFDPMDNSLNEVVAFMEQIEASEDYEKPSPSKDKSKDKSKGNGKGKPYTPNGGDKTCLIHGKCAHSSNECTILQDLAKQKKGRVDGYSPNRDSSNNKTWKKKAYDGNNKSKKDLAAFVKKAVKTGVQKELSEKKRKASVEELDLNALENELKDFNYTDDMLEELNIDDDDNISC